MKKTKRYLILFLSLVFFMGFTPLEGIFNLVEKAYAQVITGVDPDKMVGQTYEKVKKKNYSLDNYKGSTDSQGEVKEEFVKKNKGISTQEYLVPKTDSKYEIVLSNKDGSYTYLDKADNYEAAVSKAKDAKVTYSLTTQQIPAVINNLGIVVYATKAMGKIVKVINGEIDTTNSRIINIYDSSSLSNSYTYINAGYIDDVPIIEDNGISAKIQVNGYTGWINKDSTKNEYDMIIVPANDIKNPSYYMVSNGELIHFISSDITSNTENGYKVNDGKAPDYLISGVKYYSYDGLYFYTSLDTLIDDLQKNIKDNAVNNNKPNYSYYKYLPFRSKTVFSAEEIDKFINANTSATSKLRGMGNSFINAQETYGVNAALMLGVAINESAWGMSNIAQTKNNIFGINAVDASPGQSANTFSSVEACINDFAKNWISKGYADPQDWRYYGGYLGDKYLGANVNYASDPFWGEKAARYSYLLDKYCSGEINSLRDYNFYQLAVYKTTNKVVDSSMNSLYDIKGKLINTVTILNSLNSININGVNYYKATADRTTNVSRGEFSGDYNWDETSYINMSGVQAINSPKASISYQTHVQDYGWQGISINGDLNGTEGKSKRLEGIYINVNNQSKPLDLKYRTHVQDYGWQDWKTSGQFSGTKGESKRLEAIQIQFNNAPEGYHVEYRVHVQDIGWMDWKRDGDVAGTTGLGKRLEAIEIRIVVDDKPIKVQYSTHVQDYGWTNPVENGVTSGTVGQSKRLEAIKINLLNAPQGVALKYRTHIQDIGWQQWKNTGELSGTEGQSKRLEAIEITATGLPSGYKLEYRVHVQDYGWQDWKNTGETAGTTGQAKRLEAIEIRIVK